ncbi:MAG: site-specific tyrosine recombinase XerD [Geminicoccaceae bacterium]
MTAASPSDLRAAVGSSGHDTGSLIGAFLDMIAIERGGSRHTLDAYRRDLREYRAFLQRRAASPMRASSDDVRAFVAFQSELGFSASTAARRLSAVRQFHRFLFTEGHRSDDPTSKVDGPRTRRALPRYLSEAEVTALLEAASEANGIEGRRLMALMEVLYGTGLRVSELMSLPLSALAKDHSSLIERGKGGKERLVPLGRLAQTALRAYLEVRDAFLPSRKKGSPFLFPSRSALGHLTRQRFTQLIKALAIEAGIAPERVSPHVLRHAFASHLLAHGADLRSVQALLGHADIATTEIYTHLQPEKLAATLEACHPLAKRDGGPVRRNAASAGDKSLTSD